MDYLVPFGKIPWKAAMTGVRCKIHKEGTRQLRLVEYTREMEAHWCEKAHFGYILEGEFEIQFPDRSHRFLAGDGVFIPPGHDHRHMAKVLSQRVLAVFAEDV